MDNFTRELLPIILLTSTGVVLKDGVMRHVVVSTFHVDTHCSTSTSIHSYYRVVSSALICPAIIKITTEILSNILWRQD